jgi:hypothetical protein
VQIIGAKEDDIVKETSIYISPGLVALWSGHVFGQRSADNKIDTGEVMDGSRGSEQECYSRQHQFGNGPS